jgi:acetyl esterase/lipase
MMNSRHLVDPELLPMLDIFPLLIWNPANLVESRAFMEQLSEAQPLPDLPVEVSEMKAPGAAGQPDVPIILYRPVGAKERLPALLHIHGGGYVAGSPRLTGAQNRQLAHDLQCLVVSVDYRLAPEVPYPGAVEDCHAALKFLHDNADALLVDNARISIRGESAGGGLAAAVAIAARDAGQRYLAMQMLIYPMLDDRTGSAIATGAYAGEFMWDKAANGFAWRSYLGGLTGDDIPGRAAPAREKNLSDLPPTFIAVGQLDLFVAENIDYAKRLMDAGIPTELHVYPGAFHGFDLAADSKVARSFEEDARAALRRAFQHGE